MGACLPAAGLLRYNCYQGTVDLVPDPSRYDEYAYQGSPQTATAWNITPKVLYYASKFGMSGIICLSLSPKTAIRGWIM